MSSRRVLFAELRITLTSPEVNDATTDAMIKAYEDLEVRERLEALLIELIGSRYILDDIHIRIEEV